MKALWAGENACTHELGVRCAAPDVVVVDLLDVSRYKQEEEDETLAALNIAC
jgi:hypothetical protein